MKLAASERFKKNVKVDWPYAIVMIVMVIVALFTIYGIVNHIVYYNDHPDKKAGDVEFGEIELYLFTRWIDDEN